MKNYLLPFLIIVFSLFSFKDGKDRKIDADLVNIEYYSKGICKNEYPVYVRVIYSVNEKNLSLLKMKHDFSNGITATIPITETDKKGNVVYGFCAGKEEIKSFTTIFISADGSLSKEITVNINVPEAKIVAGTAPRTYKK